MCIIRQSSEEGRIIAKRAASTDSMGYGGCLVQLVVDEIDDYHGISSLYIMGAIIKIHQISCGIFHFAGTNYIHRISMPKTALYMV